MSALRTSIARASISRSAATPRVYDAQRSFWTSRVLAVGKESAVHEEGRAEKVEAHKQDQLAKQKQGKGQWKDELASDSESIVKADREGGGKSIGEMQKEGAKKAEEERR